MSAANAVNPLTTSLSTTEIECKKICVLRCLYAVGYSIAMQFLLLTLFLLFVNFSLIHPISWITSTFSLIFSIYTWLCIMPLISLVITYGVYLGKLYLSEQLTHKRRIVALYRTALPKTIFIMLHISIGFLTTWFYSRFLSDDIKRLLLNVNDCEHIDSDGTELDIDICLNERYLLLTLYGICVATIYYMRNFPSAATCHFSLIHQSKHLKIRAYVYSSLRTSLLRTFLPVFISFAVYNLMARFAAVWLLSTISNANLKFNNSVHIYDIKLLLHIWILTAHILSNMNLMAYLFEVFLAEPKQFPIEPNGMADGFSQQPNQHAHNVTLVEALANTKVPIVRQLAAQDLYTLATSKDARARRQQIYKLSIPGGHPYNWNALCAQCLSLINAYNDELKASISCITIGVAKPQNNNHQMIGGYPSTIRRSFMYATASPGGYSISNSPKTATEMAEKIRQRQYNESAGMRNMMSPTREYNGVGKSAQSPSTDPCARFNDCIGHVGRRVKAFKCAILQTPGIHYLFAESETARLHSLLAPSKTQEMAWIVQGIAAIATHSLREDHYGVVQTNLPTLIQTLLRLKVTIDKIPNLNGAITALMESHQQTNSSQYPQNCALFMRNAVKRSLYDICITFAEYLPDLIRDDEDLKVIQCFVNFKEA